MRKIIERTVFMGLGSLMIVIAFTTARSLQAQEGEAGHSHSEAKAHGGEVTMSERHHFEVVPVQEGLAVFVYDDEQKPVDIDGASGTATFALKNGEEFEVPLKPYGKNQESDTQHGSMMGSGNDGGYMNEKGHMESPSTHNEDRYMGMANNLLWADYALKGIGASEAKTTITVRNLPSENESRVRFRQTVSLNELPSGINRIMGGSAGHENVSGPGDRHHMEDDEYHEDEGMMHDH